MISLSLTQTQPEQLRPMLWCDEGGNGVGGGRRGAGPTRTERQRLSVHRGVVPHYRLLYPGTTTATPTLAASSSLSLGK
ncbi:hypothetical protein J6590_054184 [Homalodisca vitripennis]|nr:hypothetical protein J6590_054184 [Homalodisca vitripennis]